MKLEVVNFILSNRYLRTPFLFGVMGTAFGFGLGVLFVVIEVYKEQYEYIEE